jgi:hypothetical protein
MGRVGTDDDDRNVARGGIAFEALHCLQAIHAGQVHIDENEPRPVFQHQLQADLRGHDSMDLVAARTARDQFHEHAVDRAVFDVENVERLEFGRKHFGTTL